MRKIRLGVNIDHVATVREARKGFYPDPVAAAKLCETSGADSIVCHLREDRRHIQESDVKKLLETLRLPLNLEMSMAPSIVRIALRLRPWRITLVPEKREELTTEGGLNVLSHQKKLRTLIGDFREKGIGISLFIDPDEKQLEVSYRMGVRTVEFHTGCYADAAASPEKKRELKILKRLCRMAKAMHFEVAAGHGLNYKNVRSIAEIPEIEELNIGHAIASEAIFTGLGEAVRRMKRLLR